MANRRKRKKQQRAGSISRRLYVVCSASSQRRMMSVVFTKEHFRMTMIKGRIRKLTKHGYVFIDTEDGGTDVFSCAKVMERSGETVNVGDRVSFDEQLDKEGRRWADSVTLPQRAPKPAAPPPAPRIR